MGLLNSAILLVCLPDFPALQEALFRECLHLQEIVLVGSAGLKWLVLPV